MEKKYHIIFYNNKKCILTINKANARTKNIRTNKNKFRVAHPTPSETVIIPLVYVQNSLLQTLLVKVNTAYINLPKRVTPLSLTN